MYNTLVWPECSDIEKVMDLLPDGSGPPSGEIQSEANRVVKKYYSEQRHLPWALKNNFEFWVVYYEKYLEALFIEDRDRNLATRIASWSRDPSSYIIASDAVDVLTELRARGYFPGMLSNWDVTLGSFIENLGLAPFVDMILASDEIGFCKPKAEIFVEAASRMGLEISSILYVGDSLSKDIAGGNRAGMRTAWLNYKRKSAVFSEDEEPVITIYALGDLLEFLPKAPLFQF